MFTFKARSLRDLEAEFIHSFVEEGRHGWMHVDEAGRANGVSFLCPLCFDKNNGPVGTHLVICWRPIVPDNFSPGPGRWEFQGDTLDNLTLVAGSSSVQLQGGCNAHFYIRNGQAVPA